MDSVSVDTDADADVSDMAHARIALLANAVQLAGRSARRFDIDEQGDIGGGQTVKLAAFGLAQILTAR